MSIPLPPPNLNGHELTHSELRAIHQNMRIAVHAATARYCLDGPRLLRTDQGERYTLVAYGRDLEGNLLASVKVLLPQHGADYERKIRLVPWANSDVNLKVEVARESRGMYS